MQFNIIMPSTTVFFAIMEAPGRLAQIFSAILGDVAAMLSQAMDLWSRLKNQKQRL